MKVQPPNINTFWAEAFVEELARSGVRHAVIAPGSRSTPLVMSFAGHPDITDHSTYDERSAAFYALGLAKASGRAVAVVCTSGTAGANMFPAVCEADASDVPLLVLTADRPVHLRDSGAQQTMDQVRLFGPRVRWFHDVAQPEADERKLRYLRSLACDAVARAEGHPAGPVHLNFPFSKPLEPTPIEEGYAHIPSDFLGGKSEAIHGREDGRPFVRYTRSSPDVDDVMVFALADRIRSSSRRLIIAGPDAHGVEMRGSMERFVRASGIPVFAEAASQLRFQADRHTAIIGTSDLFLRSERIRASIQPDLILRFGAAPTNTPMQTFIAEYGDVPHIAISAGSRRRDPDYVISQVIEAEPASVLAALAREFEAVPLKNVDEQWRTFITQLDDISRQSLEEEIRSIHEPFIGSLVESLTALPDDTALFVSSGMPIRDVESYAGKSANTLEMFFNRGVNGIDGITSTALGVARARYGHTVLLTGDMAFLHDLNGLHLARDPRIHATVIVVNSNGSEIFGLLPVEQFDPPFTKHFETPHGYDVAKVAEFFGIKYKVVEDASKLHSVLQPDGVQIIEYRIDRRRSKALRQQIGSRIVEAVGTIEAPPVSVAQPATIHVSRFHSDARASVPAVFLHGFTKSAASWKDVIGGLKDRAVYAVDLPGHGFAASPDFEADASAFTIERCASELERFLQRNGLEHIHLIGYSMGGRVAMQYAVRHRERLASLTLISASPGIEDERQREDRALSDEKLARRIEQDGLENFVDEWMSAVMFSGTASDTETLRRAREDRMKQPASGLSSSLRGTGQGAMTPLWTELRALTMPVLLIAGSKDEAYNIHVKKMSDLIPNTRVVLADGAGHDVPMEAGEWLTSTLLYFWKTLIPESVHRESEV